MTSVNNSGACLISLYLEPKFDSVEYPKRFRHNPADWNGNVFESPV